MPQLRLSGTAKSRKAPPPIAGPPNSPLAFRVSTTRQGVAGTNCSPVGGGGGGGAALPITEAELPLRLAVYTSWFAGSTATAWGFPRIATAVVEPVAPSIMVKLPYVRSLVT